MKSIKKLSALFIAAVLVVAFLVPMHVNAEAADAGRYKIYFDADTTYFNYSWATMDSTAKIITLQKDIDFDSSGGLCFSGGSWTLDLNGKTIKATYPIIVKDGASLTLVGSGRIQLKSYFSGEYMYGSGIEARSNSTVTIRGGDIEIRCKSDEDDTKPAIYLFKGCTLNIESGNLLLKGAQSGIYAYESDVNITGGNITLDGSYGFDCYQSNLAFSGGNVTINSESSFFGYVESATVSGGALNLGSGGNDVAITQTGGVIYNKATGVVTAKSVTEDYTVPENATLTVAEGETLTVYDGAHIDLFLGSTLVNNGIIDFWYGADVSGNGTITNNGKLYVNGVEHFHRTAAMCSDNGDGTHQVSKICDGCPIHYDEFYPEPHEYDYTASNNIITESCVRCQASRELSINVPQAFTYSGNACEAVVEGSVENTKAEMYLEYYNAQEEYLGRTAPVDTGSYKVKLCVGYNDDYSYYKQSTDLYAFTVLPKHIVITSAYVEDKYYDASPVVQTGDYILDGVVDGEDVTVTVAEATLASANAGTYDKVTLSGVALTGADCGNYTIDATCQVATRDYWDQVEPIEIYAFPASISALEQTVELNGTPDQSKWEVIDLLEGHKVVSVVLIGDTSRATEFASVIPDGAVVHDAEGNDVSANYDFFYYSAIMIVTCPDHDSFENGFCTTCGGYERPTIDPGEDSEWEYDDVYLVSNAGQLLWIAEYVNNVSNEVNVKLVADITVPAGKTWTPMMNFYGTFDGNLKTVSGLYVKTEEEQVGMFGGGGYSYGTIKNLHLSNSYFEGSDYVGGIAGYHAGTIENCYVDGTVTVNSTSGNNEGALVGSLAGNAENCYAYSETLIGYYNSSYAYVTNCYYLAQTDDGNGGKTAAQFASGEVAYLLGEAYGQQIGVDAYPVFGGMKVYQAEDGTYYNDLVQKFDIDVARMVLGNALEFQFGVDMSKIPDKTGYYAVIEKTWADGSTTTKTIPSEDWGTVGTYWAIVYDGLAAKEMCDVFYVTIYNADGVAVSNVKTDSVRDYVMRNVDKSSDVLKTLMVNMLNYGAAAQVQFDYDTDDLANSLLTDTQKVWASTDVAEMTSHLVKGTNYMGTRLVLESRIQLQVAFKGMTRDMYAIYTYTDNKGEVKTVRVEGADFVDVGVLGVEMSALVYADARNVVEITVYNADGTVYGTATDSIEGYVQRNAKGDTDVSMELMKFADSAKAYLYGN